MDLETVTPGDGSQAKTNIIAYFLLVESEKNDTNLLTEQKQTHTLTE